KDPFRVLLGYRLASAFVFMELAGFILLCWRDRRGASLLLAPLAVTFAAAVAGQYPFADRLVMFLAPALIIRAVAGAGCLADILSRRMKPALGAVLLVVVSLPALERIVEDHPVARLEESAPLYAWLGQHQRPGDVLFMSLGAVPGYEWYAPRYGA